MGDNTVEIIIKASSDKAAKEIKKFVRQTNAGMVEMLNAATTQTSGVENAFKKLRIRSVAEIEKEQREIQQAYEQIANSGKASASDITRAHAAATQKQTALAQEAANAQVTAAGRVKNAWNAVKGAWLGVAAGAYAAKKAWDLAFSAAQFMEREQAFHNVVASMGADGEKLLSDLKRLSRGTVSELQLMQSAGSAINLGVPVENLNRLMEIARASAKVSGDSVAKAFDDLVLGSARQSKMILDNLGIMIDLEKANKEWAASIHKTVDALTDEEKKQALLNAAMKEGGEIIERVGMEADTAAEKMQRWKTQWKDMGVEVGKVLINIGQAVDLLVSSVALGVNSIIRGLTLPFSKLFEWASKIPGIGESWFGLWAKGAKKVDGAFESLVNGGMTHIKDTAGAMAEIWKDVEARAGAAGAAQKASADTATAAIKKNKDELKALLDQEQQAVDVRRQATEEMYREQGIGAEAAAQVESQKLIEKAAKWQQAGVNVQQINEYLYNSLAQMETAAYARGEEASAQHYGNLKDHNNNLVETMLETQAEMTAQLAAIDESLVKDRAVEIEDHASEGLREVKNLLDSIESKTIVVIAQIAAVDESLAQERAIEIEDHASETLEKIKMMLDSIEDKTVTVTMNYTSNGGTSSVTSGGIDESNPGSNVTLGGYAMAETGQTNQEFNVDFTGTGSTKKPLTEKIAEIHGMYNDLPEELKLNADMTAVTAALTETKSLLQMSATERHLTQFRQASSDQHMFSNPMGAGSFIRSSYATGTDYVPSTGIYQLHQGEAVIPAKEAGRNRAGVTIQGGVHVTVQGGDTHNPETLGRRMADAFDRAIAQKIKYGRSLIPAALGAC